MFACEGIVSTWRCRAWLECRWGKCGVNTGVSDVGIIGKCFFNSLIFAAEDVDKVLAAWVASCYAIWPVDLFMFITSPCANTNIDSPPPPPLWRLPLPCPPCPHTYILNVAIAQSSLSFLLRSGASLFLISLPLASWIEGGCSLSLWTYQMEHVRARTLMFVTIFQEGSGELCLVLLLHRRWVPEGAGGGENDTNKRSISVSL